ncbi:MAG: LytR C-terminal domain-containing protein [Salinivenus sp.]
MASWQTRVGNGILNAALLAGGLVVAVLLYAVASRTFVSTPSPDRPSEDTTALVGSVIQVEVRNGVGTEGLAARTTQFLRDHGFDVVDVGNDSSFDQQQSVVIDRVGNTEAARKVAEALGLPASRVRQDIRRQYYLDASVVIGQDYDDLRPFEQ